MNTVRSLFRMGLMFVLAVAVAGCTHTSTYNSTYLAAARRPASSTGEGKVYVMMPVNDKGYVYSGHPTSFTGGGTTLTIPLGEITYETAKSAFADRFKGGMEAGQDLKAGFSAIVSPKLQDYSYEYNQLKNLGFAITPIVRCKLLLKVLNDDGSVKSEKLYESGDVEAGSYMASLEPAEKIAQLTHKVIYDLMVKAADNAIGTLSSSSSSTGNSQ